MLRKVTSKSLFEDDIVSCVVEAALIRSLSPDSNDQKVASGV
jgi:hypothetical protein